MNVHVPFTENIRPICLPYTGINTQYYNQTGTIAGWGKTTDQNHNIVTWGTNKLREVDTLIFNTDLCGKLIHFMGNYAWRQSPSGNSISRYVTIVISTGLEKVGTAKSPSVLTGLESELPEDLEAGHDWSLSGSSESQTRDEALGSGPVKQSAGI